MLRLQSRYDWDMAEFKKRVEEALGEARDRLSDERRLDLEFRERWHEIRETVVLPACRDTAAAMKKHPALGGCTFDREDDGVVLQVFRSASAETADHGMRFKPDVSGRVVLLVTSVNKGAEKTEERFTLDALDAATVEAKILAFLGAILEHRIARRNE